ncbi:hypothetical protein PUR57_06035 [Streptomyces sp. JV176]|uniref:hypothetical protein n=1 Tax=Streptomyces sp. JV176 TaxID=858630 RepID=UPI002E778E92|nr:hypothetical protein [Streptomyces sp. JV176]MEE1798236.1 hypothetical protein [Streptomyces sp. JV176]
MSEFFGAALGFPAVLFGAALLVVIGFWLLVVVGAAEHDSFSGHVASAHLNTSAGGALGGVPVAVPVSVLIATAWFASLAGSVLVRRSVEPGTARTLWSGAVLAGAALIAWGVTRLLVRRLRDLVPEQAPPSRLDFIGLTCMIRTGSVSADFGQAEVAAADGSTALVQVRRAESDRAAHLAAGSTGLLYAFDAEGEFFWVGPYDPALDPRSAR